MSSVFKLQIHKWVRGCQMSFMSARLSQLLGVAADQIYAMMVAVRSGKLDAHMPPAPPASDWLRLYEDHRRVTIAVAEHFPDVIGNGRKAQDSLDGLRSLFTAIRREPEVFKRCLQRAGKRRVAIWWNQGLRVVHRDYKCHLKELRADMRGVNTKENFDLGK